MDGRSFDNPVAWVGSGYQSPDPEPDPTPLPDANPPPANRFERELGKDGKPPKVLASEPSHERGWVLGRFDPPHLGHQHLFDFARLMVKTLVIGIKVTDKDHIPIERRVEWLREMAPTAQIVELRGVPAVDEIDFAKTLGVILGSMGALPTHIFASEPYMRAFAENIGAALIPNDPDRLSQSARACDVRMDPYAHFDQLPAGVRAYYAGRFALVGPDGVGKTMLANVLAKHYQTVFAQEHLRVDPSAQTMLRTISGTLELMAIQQARIEAMARQCRRIVICDSEPLSLGVWYEQLTGRSDFPFEKVAKKYKADRYFYVAKYDQTSREPKRAKFEARLRDILWLTDVRRDEVVWTAVAEADANDPKKNYMLNKACASIDELLLRLKSNGRRHLSP